MRFMKAGATSQSIYLEVLDSTSTTGGRKTGLAYNTSSLTAYYVRNGGSATSITLATLAAANSAYSSGGFKEVDATNMPGVYRLDLPDAAVASGATSVVVTLKGATGMVQVSAEIQLVTFDPQDSVRMGMTALPNAAAEAAGGLFTRGTGAGQINQDANGRIDANVKAAAGTNVTLDANNVLNVSAKYMGGTLLTARDIGASVLLSNGTGTGQLDFTSGVLKGNLVQINGTSIAGTGTRVADSFVAFLNVASPVLTVASVNQTGDSYARLGAPAGASVSADVAAVKSDTGTLVTRITSTLFSGITSLAEWLGLIAGKQTGNTTARTELRATGAGSGTYDETTDSQEAIRDRGDSSWTTATGFSTLDAAGVRTAVGLASANLDTQLTAIDDYLDTEIAAIKAKTDQLTFTVANQVDANALSGGGGLDAAGVRAAVGLASANLDTQLAAIDDYIDTEVAAIKAKTDNLPADPADASDIAASFSTVNSTLATIAGYIDTEVAAIKAKTDNLPASPAATSDIPSAATVASAVRTELATELARIDVAVSTRQISIWSSAAATVNLSGTTVKAVTDAVNANITQIDSNTSAAQLLSLSARTMYSGTVTGSPTTTSFVDSGTSSYGETDQFKGRIIIFYNAEHIVKEATNITAFDPDTNAFTFAALSRAPTIGDAFIVV